MEVPRRTFFQVAAAVSLASFEAPTYCSERKSFTYTNPVYAESMPDPGVIRFENRYYAFGTTGDSRLPDGRVFRVLTSLDLVSWQERGGALTPPLEGLDMQYWAPEVAHHNGTFYLYYSVGTLPDLHFSIRVATSKRPEGPYEDTGTPLKDGDSAPFFIDGHPFRDDDGQCYLFYAKDFPNTDDGYMAGTGIVVDRLIDMTSLEGKPKLVVRPRHPWTLFEANRKMDLYGGTFDWHTIEAPWIVKREGRYYCLYSGSNFGTTNYGIDFVEADSVAGPYRNQGRYARVLRGVPNMVRGPGHHSVVITPDGKSEMVVYHAWNTGMTERQMWIDPLHWTPEGPVCLGPSVGPQSTNFSGSK